MSHVARLLVLMLTLGIGARAAGRGAAQDSDRTFDAIHYADSGGFAGGGTGMSLSISFDGRVEALARGRERAIAQLQPAELKDLRAALAAVDWVHVERIYRTAGAADLVIRDLTVFVGGNQYEVHVDSLAKIPAPLKRIFEQLDDLYRRSAGPKR
jgi:hypothetical protein